MHIVLTVLFKHTLGLKNKINAKYECKLRESCSVNLKKITLFIHLENYEGFLLISHQNLGKKLKGRKKKIISLSIFLPLLIRVEIQNYPFALITK